MEEIYSLCVIISTIKDHAEKKDERLACRQRWLTKVAYNMIVSYSERKEDFNSAEVERGSKSVSATD